MGPFRQGKPLVLPTPELDAYEKELRARSHRWVTYTGLACMLLVMPLLVMLGMAIVPGLVHNAQHPLHGLSPAAKAKVQSQIAAARARARAEESAMREGITAAIESGVEAHPELGRCPYSHAPSHDAYGYGFGASSYRHTSDSELCTACRALASDAASLEQALTERSRDEAFETRTLARAAALDRKLGYAVVLRVVARGEPRGVPREGFTPGYVRGRAYVWDLGRREVVCAGDVSAESSDAVDYKYLSRGPVGLGGSAELQHALERDLTKRTEDAVHASLRYRAGPRIVD